MKNARSCVRKYVHMTYTYAD